MMKLWRRKKVMCLRRQRIEDCKRRWMCGWCIMGDVLCGADGCCALVVASCMAINNFLFQGVFSVCS